MEIVADGPALVLTGDFDVRSTWKVRTALYDQLAAHDDVQRDVWAQRDCPAVPANEMAAPHGQAEETPAQQVPANIEVSAFGKMQHGLAAATSTQHQAAIDGWRGWRPERAHLRPVRIRHGR